MTPSLLILPNPPSLTYTRIHCTINNCTHLQVATSDHHHSFLQQSNCLLNAHLFFSSSLCVVLKVGRERENQLLVNISCAFCFLQIYAVTGEVKQKWRGIAPILVSYNLSTKDEQSSDILAPIHLPIEPPNQQQHWTPSRQLHKCASI